MALEIKRANAYLRIWLSAESMEEVTVFNKLGREFNKLYNKYLTLPAVSVKDNKEVAQLALMAAKTAVVRIQLPTYDEGASYLGNLPILTTSWSGPDQKRKVFIIKGIGSFRIAHDTELMLHSLEKLHKGHDRRNKHIRATPYTLDPTCTTSISLASVKSVGFDIAPPGVDFCLHIHY
jgi:hypothetical protein